MKHFNQPDAMHNVAHVVTICLLWSGIVWQGLNLSSTFFHLLMNRK